MGENSIQFQLILNNFSSNFDGIFSKLFLMKKFTKVTPVLRIIQVIKITFPVVLLCPVHYCFQQNTVHAYPKVHLSCFLMLICALNCGSFPQPVFILIATYYHWTNYWDLDWVPMKDIIVILAFFSIWSWSQDVPRGVGTDNWRLIWNFD